MEDRDDDSKGSVTDEAFDESAATALSPPNARRITSSSTVPTMASSSPKDNQSTISWGKDTLLAPEEEIVFGMGGSSSNHHQSSSEELADTRRTTPSSTVAPMVPSLAAEDHNSMDGENSLSTMSDSLVQHHQQSPQHSGKSSDSTIINDDVATPATGVDGSDFLKYLREAGAFEAELKNQDTFGMSGKHNARQDLNALSEIFEASGSMHLSNEDTIGRSNRSSIAISNQQRPLRPQRDLASLAELFEDPTEPRQYPSVAQTSIAAPPPPPLTPKGSSTNVLAGNPKPSPVSSRQSSTSSDGSNNIAARPTLTRPTQRPQHQQPHFGRPLQRSNSPKPALKNPLRLDHLSPTSDSAIGLPPRPQQSIHHHNRTVSWGNNTTFPPAHETDTAGLNRKPSQSEASFDSLSDLEYDTNSNAGGISGGHVRHGSAHIQHRRMSTRTKYNLQDLLGHAPYEAEAETNIIRALETQQSFRHLQRGRADSVGSSAVLGQVPENASHDFSMDDTETGLASDPLPIASSHGHGGGGGGGASSGSGGNERAKLLPNQMKKLKNHRRHLSVEQTLVGLTSAMSALHGHESVHRARLKKSNDSSASAFADNATRLSEQQERDDGSLNSAQSRHRLWRIDNLPIVDENRQAGGGSGETEDGNDDTSFAEEGQSYSPDLEAGEGHADTSSEDDGNGNQDGKGASSTQKKRRTTILGDAGDTLKAEWEAWGDFFRPRKENAKTYIKNVVLYIVVPLTGIAAILFYLNENPTTGFSPDGSPGTKASVSWWLLFTVRQVVTLSMALAMQALIIDFLSLGTRTMLRLAGPVLTLLIVQSKGWPFICLFWSIFDLALLANGGPLAHHWLYWQNLIGLFNAENPSGNVSNNPLHKTILIVIACVSASVAVKRFLIGLYLGRQTFAHYGEKLAKVMSDMLLLSEVSELAKDIERRRVEQGTAIPLLAESFGWNLRGGGFGDDGTASIPGVEDPSRKIIDPSSRDPLTGSLPAHEKAKLFTMLGQWEEPTRTSDPRQLEIASISAVLRFRKALTFIQKRYPFSHAFGPAHTREACVESAQKVYDRLMMRTPDADVLQFETLALLALDDDFESIDQLKAKELVKLFRPDREGRLTLLDFVKSVDSVYKEFRMLDASIQNSSAIDRAFENIFNVIFYIVVFTIVIYALGQNPLTLFISLSSVILGFAFMIGSASSKYFEGLLFILIRRPYNIGDRIHVSDIERDTPIDGTPGWVVENVTLFETVATWTPTRERCSLSNGSLANSRIINAARSPQAVFHVLLKFPIDTPYDKILIFKTAIEEYMKARPREWLALNGFRAKIIVADQGYVEYDIVVQHRESWQQIGQLLDSKGNFNSYCNEVARQLDMHYRAPPLPVDLRTMMTDTSNPHLQMLSQSTEQPGMTSLEISDNAEPEMDREAHVQKFRQIAMDKHNIRFS